MIPERGKQVMWRDHLIFFRELKDVEADAGPMGALSVLADRQQPP